MASDLDLARLRHIAELAELSLSAEEEARLAGEIGRIVAYVAELDAVDTTDVPPTAHVAGIEPTRSEDGWREDVVKPGLAHDDALAAAPHAEHGGFAVPSFVE
jgi:aspartyl-tRNA(Asn)/glutamyl-tRNA(Gln) amidotransferase subunit C